MFKRFAAAAAVLTALSGLSPVYAQEPLMPATAIQRGMKGTCRTVFQGSKVEPFEFEVLSVMHGMLGPGLDIILARLQGEKATFTGVVAGMSGSPCYLDGKLIGALSYRFGEFTKEPIAGITPIHDMLRIWEIKEQPAQAMLNPMLPRHRETPLQGQSSSQLKPIATPLHFSGFDPKVFKLFGKEFEALGFQPVAGSSGGQTGHPEAPKALEMGGAIAGQMVRGDISISGTGTVSYIDDKRVLAFGHPFFNSGHIQIPMATAYIQHILSSEAGSYKMAEDGVEVGTITQDRATAISGILGQQTRMLPVALQIHDQNQVDRSQVNFEVFQNPSMTPLLMATGIYNSLQGRLNFNQGGNLSLKGELTVDGKKLNFDRFYSTTEEAETPILAARDLAKTLFTLWGNPYQQPSIQGLKLNFQFRPQTLLASIEEVWVDQNEARPGESLNLHVRLKNYRQESVTRHLKVQVPSEAPYGPAILLASSGPLLDQLEDSLKTDYSSYAELLDDLSDTRSNDRLYLKWISEEPGMGMYAQIYPKLPSSVIEQLDISENISNTLPLMRSPGTEYSFPVNYDLNGQRFVRVFVTPRGRVIN